MRTSRKTTRMTTKSSISPRMPSVTIDADDQRLVGQRIEIDAQRRGLVERLGDIAVEGVRRARQQEQRERPAIGLVQDQVDDQRNREQPGKGDQVGDAHRSGLAAPFAPAPPSRWRRSTQPPAPRFELQIVEGAAPPGTPRYRRNSGDARRPRHATATSTLRAVAGRRVGERPRDRHPFVEPGHRHRGVRSALPGRTTADSRPSRPPVSAGRCAPPPRGSARHPSRRDRPGGLSARVRLPPSAPWVVTDTRTAAGEPPTRRSESDHHGDRSRPVAPGDRAEPRRIARHGLPGADLPEVLQIARGGHQRDQLARALQVLPMPRATGWAGPTADTSPPGAAPAAPGPAWISPLRTEPRWRAGSGEALFGRTGRSAARGSAPGRSSRPRPRSSGPEARWRQASSRGTPPTWPTGTIRAIRRRKAAE